MARYMDVSSTLSASSAVCAIASAAVVRRRCHLVILPCMRNQNWRAHPIATSCSMQCIMLHHLSLDVASLLHDRMLLH